jgi:hypothetical protein
MYLKACARAVLFFPVAFVLSFGTAKAITVNPNQSSLIDGNQIQVGLGFNITVALSTTGADPFDGAAGGDYNLNLFSGSNLFQSVVRSPTAGSTSDVFQFAPLQHATSIVFEARPGVSFDLLSAAFSTNDPNGSIGSTSLQAVAAPYNPTTPVPAALPLFATGLGALGLLGCWRKKKAAALAA